MKKYISILPSVAAMFPFAACAAPAAEELPAVPAAEPDPESPFGVDVNINVNTIDNWLGRQDVEYVDTRMLIDPCCYEAIGGDSMLSGTVQGFKVVPYPYLGTLTGLPPEVEETRYAGPTLFDMEFDDTGAIASVKANYLESEAIVNDLFPRDKHIFIMCGGGGYASFAKGLLIELGYDPSRIYNIGGFWKYAGGRRLDVKTAAPDGARYYAFHRLRYHMIDFNQLHPVD